MFINLKLSFEQLLAFASDGANNLIGKNNSVKAILLKKYRDIFCIHCLSHLLNLISSHAAEVLPETLEMFINGIYSYFSKSPKRFGKLKEFA